MIRAGRLRCRLRIQRVHETTDAVGGAVREWRTIALRWGGVEPMSGREFVTAGQTNSTVTHRIVLRPGPLRITPKDRIMYDDRVFGIESVVDRDERGAVLEIMATEETDP